MKDQFLKCWMRVQISLEILLISYVALFALMVEVYRLKTLWYKQIFIIQIYLLVTCILTSRMAAM